MNTRSSLTSVVSHPRAAGFKIVFRTGRREASSSGFTLVELLVVIAIIAMLVTLLLPAVQAAREAARRTQCSNNLKQIGLAVLNHESQSGKFPINIPQDACGDESLVPTGVSWMVQILPFLEEGSLFDSMDLDGPMAKAKGILNRQNRAIISQQLPMYLCPSDNSGTAESVRTDVWHYPAAFKATMGTMNYAGAIGPHNPNDASTFGGLKYCNNMCGIDMKRCTGTFWRHSYLAPPTMASFEDGTSKTFIAGEVLPEYDHFKVWALANASFAYSHAPINYVDPTQVGIWLALDQMGFHSRHPGGAQFVWGDGHVSLLTDTIDLAVYRGLSTRAGGEFLAPP